MCGARFPTCEADLSGKSQTDPLYFAQLEHAQNWYFRTFADRLGQDNFRLHVQERVVRLLERVHFHETALTAKAVIRRAGNKCFRGNLFAQPMQQDRLSPDDDLMRWGLSAKSQHLFSRTNFIDQQAYGIVAFRMLK